MKILRTPDSRFDNLPNWPFTPHYTDITDAVTGQVMRMACVERSSGWPHGVAGAR